VSPVLNCSEYLAEKLYSNGVADFNALSSEYMFELVLVNMSPINVGSGRGGDVLGASADLSVIEGSIYVDGKLYRGPIIPGSTLKGVLRSLAESIAVGLGWVDFEVEIGGKRYKCTGEALADIESWLSKENCGSEKNRSIVDSIFEKCLASPVVRLFGAPWLASHMFFYDAYPRSLEPPRRELITRVAIDRLTGSQSPGKLYTIEVVDAGVEWVAKIKLVNVDPFGDSREARLLRLLLKMLKDGVSVGRRTSVGHGVLRLDIDKSSVEKRTIREDGTIVREVFPLKKLLEVDQS